MKIRSLLVPMSSLWVLTGILFFSTGCLPVRTPVAGVIVTDVYGPLDAGTKVGKKEGVACAHSVFGLVANGDASIKTAAKNGGITHIDSVDHHTKNTLGIADFCTIVHGS